jgi:hypothetical protein
MALRLAMVAMVARWSAQRPKTTTPSPWHRFRHVASRFRHGESESLLGLVQATTTVAQDLCDGHVGQCPESSPTQAGKSHPAFHHILFTPGNEEYPIELFIKDFEDAMETCAKWEWFGQLITWLKDETVHKTCTEVVWWAITTPSGSEGIHVHRHAVEGTCGEDRTEAESWKVPASLRAYDQAGLSTSIVHFVVRTKIPHETPCPPPPLPSPLPSPPYAPHGERSVHVRAHGGGLVTCR